jgi:restriction endonuclease S subunit
LDADYYRPEYLRLETLLTQCKLVRLADVAFITDGIHASPDTVEEDGVSYLSAKSVKDNFFTLSNLLHISKTQDASNKRTRLRVDDVLLTTVGTIGNAAVVIEDILPANIDRHVGLIRPKTGSDSDIDPYFLSTFLNSDFGRFQTLREATGNVQLNLFLEKIRELKIALLPESNKISVETRRAYGKLKTAEQDYLSAAKVFEEETGFTSVKNVREITYESRFSDLTKNHRLDAEFYQPLYERLTKTLQKTKPLAIQAMGQLTEFVTNGHTPLRHDLSVGKVHFLTAEHVFDFRVDFTSDKRVQEEHHRTELAGTQLKEGDVLITIKGRIGNAAVIENLPHRTNINQDVALLRFRKDISPYYVVAFMNSEVGKALSQKYCTGQINPFLGLGNLKSIPVPTYQPKLMDKIADRTHSIVSRAQKEKDEALSLLRGAKSLIKASVTRGA